MENHTDSSPIARREPTRHESPEATAKRERLSITEWMAKTLDEMKRRTGWFKEDPEVTRIHRLAAPYPDLQAGFDRKLERLHRRADVALKEAESELAGVSGQEVRPAKIEQPFRLLRMPGVDPANREAWGEVKYEIIKEFDRAFGKNTPAPQTNDFEVTTLAPSGRTTLGEMREQGKRRIRVRSESIGGVRVDGLVDARQPDRWSEFRIYETSGHFLTVPGNEDPMDHILRYAEYNANALQYAMRGREQRRENNQYLFTDQARVKKLISQPFTAEEVVQAEDWRLALPQDYNQTSAQVLSANLPKGVKLEPTVGPMPERHKPYMAEEPTFKPKDQRFEALSAAYGPEVAQRLEENLFANQEDFDSYYKLWELATHNETLKPDQAMLMRRVFDALQIEGHKKNLMGKGSYAYVVESYKKIENDLPKLKESIETVNELIQDPTTPSADKATYQKELDYLHHLRARTESEKNVSLHARVEQFLENYQQEFTLGEINDILRADQALDTARLQDREKAKAHLAEAMDFPARLVLQGQIDTFLSEYGRFTTDREKQKLQQRAEELLSTPGVVNFWNELGAQNEMINSIKARSWERVARESLDRLNKALQQYPETFDDTSFALVSKLRDQLQQAVPTTPGEKFTLEKKQQMQEILAYYEPVEFERYLTTLLSEVTGKDMRPAWQKTDEELASERASTTFVVETVKQPPTPVEVEWEMEDVSAEIPGLVRILRGIRFTPDETDKALHRARKILEQAGTEEIREITGGMLQRLDQLKKMNRIDDRAYGRAIATLLNADNFNAREKAVRIIASELPVPFLHPLGQHPAIGETQTPGQKESEPAAKDKKIA